jgi:hypothetical protein
MGSLRDKGIKLTAKAFNLERKKLFKADSSLILLKPDGGEVEYVTLRTFEKDFIVRHNSFRNEIVVEIAIAEDIGALLKKTSNIVFDGWIYDVTEADMTPPFGDRFSWMITSKVDSRPYTP